MAARNSTDTQATIMTTSYPILQPFKYGADPRIQRRGIIDLTDEQAGPLQAAGLIGAAIQPRGADGDQAVNGASDEALQQAGNGASDEAGESTPGAIPGPAPAAEPIPDATPAAPVAKRATRAKKAV